MLFRTLQQNIQLRNVINDSMPFQLPVNLLTSSPSSLPRQTLQASVVHRSSIDNGQIEARANGPSTISNNVSLQTSDTLPTVNQSPRSPSSTDILEVMPLYPRPQNGTNHVTNVYQMREFKTREHNNNQTESGLDSRHVYCNDFNRDLAALRSTLKQEFMLNTIKDIEDESQFLQNRHVNENVPLNNANTPISPTLSNMSEHYAQLSMEQQEAARLYVNIIPGDLTAMDINADGPTTPLTPKQPDYSNLNLNMKPEMNSYANLAIDDAVLMSRKRMLNYNAIISAHTQKHSESDTYTSMSPIEELEINYAVLDIETNKESNKSRDLASPEGQFYATTKNESLTSQCVSMPRGRLTSQGSTEKPPAGIGYTTIDFDKTVALTSMASGIDMDIDNEGSRKTRHNSANIVCISPGFDRGRCN
ncbi:hypothetical protein EVAR_13593_1 [Eumeta japonica]|uniref:Uncharacterized protein n=1 Tax=Eumeta variegata TaxID=151549 RepID=A0A4C1U8V9_EUMVA|nr:hypothetical protein EVAR_13593_1 [Eumeta japonica]